MLGGLKLHVIHVAGTRMIKQGTDGLSRGVLLEGVMKGEPMLDFVPLNKSAVKRSAELLPWIQSWWGSGQEEPLNPEQCFFEGHGLVGGERNAEGIWMPRTMTHGHFIWTLPPAAAEVALEELVKSRHKRPELGHIFCLPSFDDSILATAALQDGGCCF